MPCLRQYKDHMQKNVERNSSGGEIMKKIQEKKIIKGYQSLLIRIL